MTKSWYAKSFLTMFNKHLRNLYRQYNSISTHKFFNFYTLPQGVLLTQATIQVNFIFLFYHKILSSFVNSLSILTLLLICGVCNFSMIFCNLESQLNLIGAIFIKVLYSESKYYLNLLADWCFFMCSDFTLSFYFYFYKVIQYFFKFLNL